MARETSWLGIGSVEQRSARRPGERRARPAWRLGRVGPVGPGSGRVARTFDELVAMQRSADQAHLRVEQLRDDYGPPAHTHWTQLQNDTYDTAWRAWRDLARAVQSAVTEYAREQGIARNEVEADVKTTARHSGLRP